MYTDNDRDGSVNASKFLSEQDVPNYLKAGSRKNINRQERYNKGQKMVMLLMLLNIRMVING